MARAASGADGAAGFGLAGSELSGGSLDVARGFDSDFRIPFGPELLHFLVNGLEALGVGLDIAAGADVVEGFAAILHPLDVLRGRILAGGEHGRRGKRKSEQGTSSLHRA